MRKIILAILAIGAMAAISASPAEAWGGCGPNRHPTPYGCRWNGGWVHPGWGWHRPWGFHRWHRWHRHW